MHISKIMLNTLYLLCNYPT